MFGIDWSDLKVYHYLAFGGGGLALLALVLYFVLPKGLKIPAGIISTVAALVAGVGVGVVGMAAMGYETRKTESSAGPPGGGGGPPPDMAAMMKGPKDGMPGMGGKGGGGKGGGGFGKGGFGKGGGGPNNKNQLAQLITKIQQLTEKPLTITLSDAQRTVLRDQLKGLEDKEELSEDDAKTRLDAILDAFKDEKKTLENAGFRWPGSGPAMPTNTPNPFLDDNNNDHLKALQKAVGQKK